MRKNHLQSSSRKWNPFRKSTKKPLSKRKFKLKKRSRLRFRVRLTTACGVNSTPCKNTRRTSSQKLKDTRTQSQWSQLHLPHQPKCFLQRSKRRKTAKRCDCSLNTLLLTQKRTPLLRKKRTQWRPLCTSNITRTKEILKRMSWRTQFLARNLTTWTRSGKWWNTTIPTLNGEWRRLRKWTIPRPKSMYKSNSLSRSVWTKIYPPLSLNKRSLRLPSWLSAETYSIFKPKFYIFNT